MFPIAASFWAAVSSLPPEPEAADPLDELDPELEPELEPEFELVEAVDEDVEALESPALSVVDCDAVSHAVIKKATATSAIRRCNMLMLLVFVRLTGRLSCAYQRFSGQLIRIIQKSVQMKKTITLLSNHPALV